MSAEIRRGVAYYIREEGGAKVVKTFKDIAKASTGAARGVDLAQKALDRIGREGKEVTGVLHDSSRAADQFGDRARRAGERGAGGFRRFRDELVPLEAGISLVQKAIGTMRAAVDAASGPVNLAIDFNRSFNEIRTLTEDVTADMRQQFSDLGPEIGRMGKEAADAIYDGLSGGRTAQNVTEFVRDAAGAAKAANSELATTSKVLLGTTNAFASQQLTSAEASDVLFATIAAGITRMDDLSASLGKVNAMAASAGQGFNVVGGVVAALTKQGNDTSRSVNLLAKLLKELTKPANKTAKVFRKLGFEFGFARLRSDGLKSVLLDLEERAAKAGVEIGEIFRSSEATAAALGLMGENTGAFHEALDRTTNSAGATARALSKMEGDAKGLVAQVKAGTEALLRDLGQEMLPTVKAVMVDLIDYMKTDGPALVETFRETFEAAVDLGRWVAENGKQLIGFATTFFVASRVTKLAKAITGDLLPAITRLAAGGGLGSALSVALKSPTTIGVAAGGAYLLGKAIGETIGDVMAAEAYESMAAIEEEAKRRAAEFKRQYGMDIATGVSRRDRVNSGASLGYGRRPDDPLFDVTAADLVKSKVASGETRQDARAAAEDEVMKEVAARAADAKKLEQEADLLFREVDRIRTKASSLYGTANAKADELLARAQRGREEVKHLRDEAKGLKAAASALSATLADIAPEPKAKPKTSSGGGVAQLKKDADELMRQAQRLNDELVDRRIAQIQNGGERERQALAVRHERELRDRKLSFEQLFAVLEVQGSEQRNLEARLATQAAEKAATRRMERARFEAEFIEDETDRALEQRRLQYVEELDAADKHGSDMLAVVRKYHQDRQRIVAQAAAAEAAAHAAATAAVLGSAIQIAEELGIAQDAVAVLKAAEMGARAAEEGAHAAAAFASGNIPQSIAHGAAAVEYSFAAAKWGGAAIGVTSAPGAGGGAGQPAAETNRRTVDSGQREQTGGPTNISYTLNFPGRALMTRRDIEDATMRTVARGAERNGQQRFSMRRASGGR